MIYNDLGIYVFLIILLTNNLYKMRTLSECDLNTFLAKDFET